MLSAKYVCMTLVVSGLTYAYATFDSTNLIGGNNTVLNQCDAKCGGNGTSVVLQAARSSGTKYTIVVKTDEDFNPLDESDEYYGCMTDCLQEAGDDEKAEYLTDNYLCKNNGYDAVAHLLETLGSDLELLRAHQDDIDSDIDDTADDDDDVYNNTIGAIIHAITLTRMDHLITEHMQV